MADRITDDDENPEDFILGGGNQRNSSSAPPSSTLTEAIDLAGLVSMEVEQDNSLLNAGQDKTQAEPVSAPILWKDDEVLARPSAPTTSWQGTVTAARLLAIKRIFVCAFAGLFVVALLTAVSQTASLIRNVEILPNGLRIAAYVAVGILWILCLYAMVYAFYIYSRMAPSPRISLAALDAMGLRSSGRQGHDAKVACELIAAFLKNYPRSKEQEQLLKLGGMGDDAAFTVKKFYSCIANAQNNDFPNAHQWIQRVNTTVLTPLDDVADRLIRRRAIMVGFKTAVSPRGVIDSIIVLTHSWLLVGELCKLYSLRPNAWETSYIVGFVGLNAIISDKGDDAAANLQGAITNQVQNFATNVAAGLIGMLASRAAEGTVNGLLIHRLGLQLKSYLRPVREGKS